MAMYKLNRRYIELWNEGKYDEAVAEMKNPEKFMEKITPDNEEDEQLGNPSNFYLFKSEEWHCLFLLNNRGWAYYFDLDSNYANVIKYFDCIGIFSTRPWKLESTQVFSRGTGFISKYIYLGKFTRTGLDEYLEVLLLIKELKK